jgi:hypothetical protein
MNLSLGLAVLGLTFTTQTMQSCATLTTTPPAKETSLLVIRQAVCSSFEPIRFNSDYDRPELIKKIREHNAAYNSFMCESLK